MTSKPVEKENKSERENIIIYPKQISVKKAEKAEEWQMSPKSKQLLNEHFTSLKCPMDELFGLTAKI